MCKYTYGLHLDSDEGKIFTALSNAFEAKCSEVLKEGLKLVKITKEVVEDGGRIYVVDVNDDVSELMIRFPVESCQWD